MENQQEQNAPPPNACIACGNPQYEPDYPTKLCTECRTKFSRLRFPLWIKLFTAVTAALMVYGLIIGPTYLASGIHLERARAAESEARYATAAREYEYVVNHNPGKLDLTANLFHAYFRNETYDKAIALIPSLEGRRTEDIDLANRVNADMDNLGLLFGDSIGIIIQPGMSDSARLQAILTYMQKADPESPAGLYLLSDVYFNLHDYTRCDSIALLLYTRHPGFPGIFHLLGAIRRENGNYDEGIHYYDLALAKNMEDVGAICGKARIELKRKNDALAGEYIAQAKEIDPGSPLTLEASSLYLFLTGKKKEALAELETLRKGKVEGDSVVYARVAPYITGNQKYR